MVESTFGLGKKQFGETLNLLKTFNILDSFVPELFLDNTFIKTMYKFKAS